MRQRLLVLATPVALLAGGWAIFYVLKQPPEDDGCGSAGPGVEAYRTGLGAYASLSAAVVGGLILSLADGPRTRYALAACAWLAGLYHLENDAFEPHLTSAALLALFGGELVLFVTALVALASPRPRGSLLVYLWLVLLVGIPAAITFPALEGAGWLCLDGAIVNASVSTFSHPRGLQRGRKSTRRAAAARAGP